MRSFLRPPPPVSTHRIAALVIVTIAAVTSAIACRDDSAAPEQLDPNAVAYSFVTLGCNRVAAGDTLGNASTANVAQLQQTFPDGVCDWTKPGVGQQPNLTWLTYQDKQGNVIYGGKPMPPAPASKPLK